MSQHVLPTWQTGLSSPSPHSLPSCSGSARPSVRPSIRPCVLRVRLSAPLLLGLAPSRATAEGV